MWEEPQEILWMVAYDGGLKFRAMQTHPEGYEASSVYKACTIDDLAELYKDEDLPDWLFHSLKVVDHSQHNVLNWAHLRHRAPKVSTCLRHF